MSALAQLLVSDHSVSGSDRSWPAQDAIGLFAKLQAQGIRLFPQNGVGITPATDAVILSTAIEQDNPDILKAMKLGKKLIHRSDLLAQWVRERECVAVGGTSGKSTICGMASVLLDHAGLSPSMINGGEVYNYISDATLGNSKRGSGTLCVIEADESDGTLTKYRPKISILSNISLDHKTPEELKKLFCQFAEQTRETFIYNRDCPTASEISWPNQKQITYGIQNRADIQAREIKLESECSQFVVDEVRFRLRLPGLQNVSNALAAIAAGRAAGVPLTQMPPALEAFRGIRRRLDLVFRKGAFRLFDDFAHNPDKIRASLRAILPHCRRLVAIFQPHGYTPTRFLFAEYVKAFSEELRREDTLFLLPIFDAGGTADRTISSEDLARDIRRFHPCVEAVPSREALLEKLCTDLRPDDTVVVMGARDNTLTALCHAIASLSS